MLAEMTWPQFCGWLSYFRLEPFGEERADLRAGTIAATVANTVRGRDQRAAKPSDFMPEFGESDEPAQPITDPEQWKVVKGWLAADAAGRSGQ